MSATSSIQSSRNCLSLNQNNNTMLALQFSIPTTNSLIPPKVYRSSRCQTWHFPSVFPICPQKLRASSTEVASPEEEDKSLNGSVSVNDISPDNLPEGLQREAMPRHVAVIMDGNGRWDRRRGLLPWAGHEAGARTLKEMVDLCCRFGIQVLTVFAFSYDNWVRPTMEVGFLMMLFERHIKSELEDFRRKGVRISVIGDPTKLPNSLRKLIADVEERTKDNTKLQLIMAISYSGKYDVVQACKTIAQKAKDGMIQLEDINENLIEQELETSCTRYPYPDLLIRTSGELRVSNFLLWQMAYTEFVFVQTCWPDFTKDEFIEALFSFQQRQRRYGGRN